MSGALSGLSPATTYHYRVVATAIDGTSVGADQTFTTAASPPDGGGGGGGGGGGATALPAVTRETLSPAAFRAASSGPSALASKKRPAGTRVSYTLNEAASVRFAVVKREAGRRASRGRCVKPTKANRKARNCTHLVAVSGRFTRSGKAGANTFRFTGRLNGHKLKPGSYKLVATPSARGRTGTARSAAFRILR